MRCSHCTTEAQFFFSCRLLSRYASRACPPRARQTNKPIRQLWYTDFWCLKACGSYWKQGLLSHGSRVLLSQAIPQPAVTMRNADSSSCVRAVAPMSKTLWKRQPAQTSELVQTRRCTTKLYRLSLAEHTLRMCFVLTTHCQQILLFRWHPFGSLLYFCGHEQQTQQWQCYMSPKKV